MSILKTQYMTFRNQKANLYATNLEFFLNCGILTGVNRILEELSVYECPKSIFQKSFFF